MKAIDLYSGIGGWALGLKVAGIDVVASYERWESAAVTEERNLQTPVDRVNIRTLDSSLLPSDVDIVVGSPPCTGFSFSNRGGFGDIADGLKDIGKFLEIVESVRPACWAMENVPRVKSILERELAPEGALSRFVHLRKTMEIEVIDMSRFGLPQRRKRCIAGNFDLGLLEQYADSCQGTTLGDVLSQLEKTISRDLNFGVDLDRSTITEQVKEPFFDEEETRINKEAKEYHPVYNGMRFPDPRDEPARTVTATCTRVSRESVIVADVVRPRHYRRLTIRERAALQGFPLTYQFFGNSYSEKLKMIGNAIPPVFTYYLVHSMLGTPPTEVQRLSQVGYEHHAPEETPSETLPDRVGRSYPWYRRFWFAIPNLRFKSGTRFDLANSFDEGDVSWNVSFFFGPSTDIRSVPLDECLFRRIQGLDWIGDAKETISNALRPVEGKLVSMDLASMQRRWSDKDSDAIHPFELLDLLGKAAGTLINGLPALPEEELVEFVLQVARESHPSKKPVGGRKLAQYALPIFVGLLLGSWFNTYIDKVARQEAA